MKVRNLGRQANHSKDGQMKPDRGNSLACRKIQRRNIPRNIYLGTVVKRIKLYNELIANVI